MRSLLPASLAEPRWPPQLRSSSVLQADQKHQDEAEVGEEYRVDEEAESDHQDEQRRRQPDRGLDGVAYRVVVVHRDLPHEMGRRGADLAGGDHSLCIFLKDARLAQRYCDRLSVPQEVGPLAQSLCQRLVGHGVGGQFVGQGRRHAGIQGRGEDIHEDGDGVPLGHGRHEGHVHDHLVDHPRQFAPTQEERRCRASHESNDDGQDIVPEEYTHGRLGAHIVGGEGAEDYIAGVHYQGTKDDQYERVPDEAQHEPPDLEDPRVMLRCDIEGAVHVARAFAEQDEPAQHGGQFVLLVLECGPQWDSTRQQLRNAPRGLALAFVAQGVGVHVHGMDDWESRIEQRPELRGIEMPVTRPRITIPAHHDRRGLGRSVLAVSLDAPLRLLRLRRLLLRLLRRLRARRPGGSGRGRLARQQPESHSSSAFARRSTRGPTVGGVETEAQPGA